MKARRSFQTRIKPRIGKFSTKFPKHKVSHKDLENLQNRNAIEPPKTVQKAPTKVEILQLYDKNISTLGNDWECYMHLSFYCTRLSCAVYLNQKFQLRTIAMVFASTISILLYVSIAWLMES